MKSTLLKSALALLIFVAGLFVPYILTFVLIMVFGILTRGFPGIIVVALLLDALYALPNVHILLFTSIACCASFVGYYISQLTRPRFQYIH